MSTSSSLKPIKAPLCHVAGVLWQSDSTPAAQGQETWANLGISENNICQEWWINNNIFGLAVTMSWISWIIAADCYNLASLALHTPSSVIMDQSRDGSVVSLLGCVLLSWIKARNSLWFYFWSHDTVFIYTAPATYPTINNSNVKNEMIYLKYH